MIERFSNKDTYILRKYIICYIFKNVASHLDANLIRFKIRCHK